MKTHTRRLALAACACLAQAPFNVAGVLTDPQLQLFNSAGVLVLANDNWSTDDAATRASVGAFSLANGSRDAALVATLSPGAYTAQVNGANNGTGVAILEIYDVSGSARLMNLSTRAVVGTGELGCAEQVTTFTASDFGRTCNTNGDGSDHGWGSNHFEVGGAVKGGDIYGRMADLTVRVPGDAGTRGLWIPTTSVDEYSATLASWFGVSATNLAAVLPNIGRVAKPNLGFL